MREKPPPGTKHPTMRHGSPKFAGSGDRQVDGARTAVFSKPVRKGGLAAREAVPRGPNDSGLERSMMDLADKEHPGK